jgi:hypothetical protein
MNKLQKFNGHELIINDLGYPANWDLSFDDTIQSRISVFPKNIRNTTRPIHTDLLQVYKAIKSTKYRNQTEALRAIKHEDRNKNYKASYFAYATFSGLFMERSASNLINHSGLVCIDIDHLPDLNETRNKLIRDSHTVMLFVSPNGNGLKLIVKIEPDPTKQRAYYEAIGAYLIDRYNIPNHCIDTSCSDVSRACFMPYDPNVFINNSLIENLVL